MIMMMKISKTTFNISTFSKVENNNKIDINLNIYFIFTLIICLLAKLKIRTHFVLILEKN
jgi:hypothetical protein